MGKMAASRDNTLPWPPPIPKTFLLHWYIHFLSLVIEPPSKPLNLHNISKTSTSLSVEWSPPEYLGERDDLYYTVEYSDPRPDRVGEMIQAQCGEGCLTGTSCNITGLWPATTYVVRVTAHNGVSDQDAGGALARQEEITLTTDIAREFIIMATMNFTSIYVMAS